MSLEAVVQFHEGVSVQATPFFLKKTVGKGIIHVLVQRLEVHHLGALEEGALRRSEHLGHEAVLAAGKDEMHVGGKLDVRAKHGLGAALGVVSDLLELVDGDINLAPALGQQVKNLLDGQLGPRGIDGYHHLGHTCIGIGAEDGAQAAQQGRSLLHERLLLAGKAIEHH